MKDRDYEVADCTETYTAEQWNERKAEMLVKLGKAKAAVLLVSVSPDEREWFTLPAEKDEDSITIGDVYRALAFYDVMTSVESGDVTPWDAASRAARFAPPFIARGLRDAMEYYGPRPVFK